MRIMMAVDIRPIRQGKRFLSGARILRVCDVYAALISDRPYRKGFDIATVMELMIDEVKNFDMQVFLGIPESCS